VFGRISSVVNIKIDYLTSLANLICFSISPYIPCLIWQSWAKYEKAPKNQAINEQELLLFLTNKSRAPALLYNISLVLLFPSVLSPPLLKILIYLGFPIWGHGLKLFVPCISNKY